MKKEKTLDDVMKELGIRICPICGDEFTEHPAISRKDNITEICPKCGMKEALDGFINERLVNKEDDSRYCIFEKRICRYARKRKNENSISFECSAKSDEVMTCKRK